MRKKYDFSGGVRGRRAAGHQCRPTRPEPAQDGDDWPLTKAQIRELNRRLADSRDRTRYLLASVFGPKFALYYSVSEDTYGMNDPRHATLFKRRAAALAIRRLLGSGVRVLRCRVDRLGRLVLRSVPKGRQRANTS